MYRARLYRGYKKTKLWVKGSEPLFLKLWLREYENYK